jgi:hypothetical protein
LTFGNEMLLCIPTLERGIFSLRYCYQVRSLFSIETNLTIYFYRIQMSAQPTINLNVNIIQEELGASVAGIGTLLSKDFLKLVLIGFVIAVPIGWYGMNRWLENFAYRIDIRPGVFLLAV